MGARFRRHSCAVDAKLPLDQAHLSHDATAILPWGRLALSKRVHNLETLDRGIGCLQRFKAAHRLDQLFQFAMIGFNHIVEIFDLTMQRFVGQFTLLLQLPIAGP